MKSPYLLLNAVFLFLIVFHSLDRDIKLESHFPSDLRNRVVGARLQKDKKFPYSYVWHPADGSRYFDPSNHNLGTGTSNITASPFFHQLLIPFIEWPQRTISVFWFVLQYLFLAAMIMMTCSLTGNRTIRWLIVDMGILFTLTEAWKDMISAGQMYFFEGFLISLICYALVRNKKSSFAFAGIMAVVFVLTRPIGLVIFIPFLFCYKKYFIFLGTACISFCLYGLFVLTSNYQQDLYRNYAESMKTDVLIHQGLYKPGIASQPESDPFPVLEGFDSRKARALEIKDHIPVYTESGNIFVVYDMITRSRIPIYILNIVSASTVLLLSILFFFRNRGFPVNELQIVLFAFTLYMIVELFIPVHRHQYNTVQWFPLVLSGLVLNRSWKSPEFILLLLGLLLNISNTGWIPMRHTIGELCWLTAILILVFSPDINTDTWKLQS